MLNGVKGGLGVEAGASVKEGREEGRRAGGLARALRRIAGWGRERVR